jgi:hypothetical protein
MNKIGAEHASRRACVYIRQSTPDQVQNNVEAQRLQYALVDRARTLGWEDVDVDDSRKKLVHGTNSMTCAKSVLPTFITDPPEP